MSFRVSIIPVETKTDRDKIILFLTELRKTLKTDSILVIRLLRPGHSVYKFTLNHFVFGLLLSEAAKTNHLVVYIFIPGVLYTVPFSARI